MAAKLSPSLGPWVRVNFHVEAGAATRIKGQLKQLTSDADVRGHAAGDPKVKNHAAIAKRAKSHIRTKVWIELLAETRRAGEPPVPQAIA
jgi:hypothetical protein